MADTSWSFSLQALYSASGPYQPLGYILSLRTSPLHGSLVIIIFIVCSCSTNISCRYLLGLRASPLPSYPIGISLAPFGFRGSWECVQIVRSFSSA